MSDFTAWLPAGVRVMPVVVIDDARNAPHLLEALANGGVPCAEITLRTPGALNSIEAVAHVPGRIVGAGTVTDAASAKDAIAAGAQFLVSPGFGEDVWAVGREHDVLVIPGVATATEAQRAMRAGARVVKFFPAATSGGIAGVSALSGPFPSLSFMPTGGVELSSARAWLQVPSVVAVGGSWLAPRELIAAQRFEEIQLLATETTATLSQDHGEAW